MKEDEPIAVCCDGDSTSSIRRFTLECNSASVQVSSLGASIQRVLLPSRHGGTEDVVLGFASLQDMLETKNPPYFNSVVGRVANRIQHGKLVLDSMEDAVQLDRNNGPNHLHGGFVGFSNRIWESEPMVDDNGRQAIQFRLFSDDGDQKYPGAIRVQVTYSLVPSSHRFGVRLCVKLEAILVGDKPTPVNLSHHSYFNLHRHDSPSGCLEHQLTLHADAYTPVDQDSIPTRDVRRLSDDPVMDFSRPRFIKHAIAEYAVTKAGKTLVEAQYDVESRSRVSPDIAMSGRSGPGSTVNVPYGFDHNYVVRPSPDKDDDVRVDERRPPVVAVLEHCGSGRKLTVRSDAPGIQLYTANFLDGVSLSTDLCKDSAVYRQWQGICLETQHFPDSVSVDEAKYPDFAKGRCVILRPNEGNRYLQNLEYEFEFDGVPSSTTTGLSMMHTLRGSDVNGGVYESVDDMWNVQGDRSSWYDRAAEYYEENCEPNLDGVLGGFASISDLDLKGSRAFLIDLEHLQNASFSWSLGAACECGAGIGRVSKGLLLPLGVHRCDIVESSSRLISTAPEYIGDKLVSRCRFFCTGLQHWEPLVDIYSIVWIQWVLCYLTDDDAVEFLRRCGSSLIPGGFIVLKENTCVTEGFVLDVDDSSVTRSVPYLRSLIERAGLQTVYQKWETDFPDDIFPVPMLALQPIEN